MLIIGGFARLLSGDFFGGLWTAFIGWFLNSAAESTHHDLVQREAFQGVKVAAIMDPSPIRAASDLSVLNFIFDDVLQRGHRALPIVDNGQLVGIVSVADAKQLPRDAWPTTTMATIMTPAPLKTVSPDADVSVAVALMAESGLHQLPVIRNGSVVGLLSRGDIMRFLQLRQELHLPSRGTPPVATAKAAATIVRS